jgi:hypothetical protein
MQMSTKALRQSHKQFREAMQLAHAIASASKAAVERHAKLGESIATIHDGKVEVVPASAILERWRRADALEARQAKQKTSRIARSAE